MTDMSKIKLFVGIIQSSGIKERIRKHNVEIDGAMELFNVRFFCAFDDFFYLGIGNE